MYRPPEIRPGEVITYPAPAKGDVAWFAFSAAGPCRVKVRIYNVAGELVETLDRTVDRAGTARVPWDIRGVAAGVYLFRLQTEGAEGTRDHGLKRLTVVH